MVQWSPDNVAGTGGASYDYGENFITHFSLTNFSGRGCPSEQDISFMPIVGKLQTTPADEASYQSTFSHQSEQASPGYYAVRLGTPHTLVQLSVTARTGFGRFTYPGTHEAAMLINPSTDAGGETNPSAIRVDPARREVFGFGSGRDGCGSNRYTIFFAAFFDRPFSGQGSWEGSTIHRGSTSSSGPRSGAYVTFDTSSNQVVQVKVGISYVSVANAESNVATEDAAWNLGDVINAAQSAWEAKLDQIQIAGGSQPELTAFYTALYHTLIHPSIFSDDNGEYTGFDGKVHQVAPGTIQYQDIPAWDQYRTLMPLDDLLDPRLAGDIITSLENDARQDPGQGLPRWEIADTNTGNMEGDPTDDIVATAYALGVRGFNAPLALELMRNGATNPGATSSGSPERPGLSDYLSHGYVSSQSYATSGSLTVQYSIDDYSIAQLARALGDTADYDLFSARAHNWENLFHDGYLDTRNGSGQFANVGPGSTSGYREGTNSQYIWMLANDLPAVISRLGGRASAAQQLSAFLSELNAGTASPYLYMGNEPGEVAPWDPILVGEPYVSQSAVRQIETQLFPDMITGLPGNDDAGSLSSWFVFASLGLFPEIQGLPGFVLGTPLFPAIEVHLENGSTLLIEAPGASDATAYIAGLTVNGRIYNANAWINAGSLLAGGTLQFSVSSTPSRSWGTALNLSASAVRQARAG
jgi:predicted alpha-1,2-mannosidase